MCRMHAYKLCIFCTRIWAIDASAAHEKVDNSYLLNLTLMKAENETFLLPYCRHWSENNQILILNWKKKNHSCKYSYAWNIEAIKLLKKQFNQRHQPISLICGRVVCVCACAYISTSEKKIPNQINHTFILIKTFKINKFFNIFVHVTIYNFIITYTNKFIKSIVTITPLSFFFRNKNRHDLCNWWKTQLFIY